MNKTEKLTSNLRKHVQDYYTGKTQDFEQVFKDCLSAADTIAIMTMADEVANMHIKEVTVKPSCSTKLCELKVDNADSLKELVYQLTANGYRVDAAPVYKEFPKTGIDYWMIAIFDKEEK